MNHRKQIETFNYHLEAWLHDDKANPRELEDTDLQALEIACRLAALDLSTQSKRRFPLRRKLTQKARLCTQTLTRLNGSPSVQSPATLVIALPGATLLFVLVFVLGWTFANLGRLPASSALVSATAFAQPGTSIESGLPPQDQSFTVQTFSPQPLPTPIAPRQSDTLATSTSGPNQTPSQTSPRAGPIILTQVKP